MSNGHIVTVSIVDSVKVNFVYNSSKCIYCNHHPWQHFIQTNLNNLVLLSTASFFVIVVLESSYSQDKALIFNNFLISECSSEFLSLFNEVIFVYSNREDALLTKLLSS